MTARLATIARYTALEALRTRLPGVTVAVALLALGASYFFRELALLEGARIQVSLYAAAVRLAAVCITALHILSSLAREANDKALDAVLGLDVPRGQYVLAKYLGYAAAAAPVAIASALPLAALTDGSAAALWFCSLLLELALVAALALFCGVTFAHVLPAGAFVAGFYILARSIDGLRQIGEHPAAGAEGLAHQLLNGLLYALALLVPHLDQWTRTAWLLAAQEPWHALPPIAVQAVVYGTLLIVAAVIDFRGKSL